MLECKTEAGCRWLKELGRELEERVAVDRAENAREPKLLTVHAGNISRSGPLRRPTADCIAEDSLALVGVPLLPPASLPTPGSTPAWKQSNTWEQPMLDIRSHKVCPGYDFRDLEPCMIMIAQVPEACQRIPGPDRASVTAAEEMDEYKPGMVHHWHERRCLQLHGRTDWQVNPVKVKLF